MRLLLQAIDSKSLPIRPTVATENLIRIINCMLNNYAKIFMYLFILSLMLTITEKILFTIKIAVKC